MQADQPEPKLPFDEIMRRALLVKPDKPKKQSRPKTAPKKKAKGAK